MATQCRTDDVEDMRERMRAAGSGLVVVGGADDHLRVNKHKKHLERVTQSMVDRCIVVSVTYTRKRSQWGERHILFRSALAEAVLLLVRLAVLTELNRKSRARKFALTFEASCNDFIPFNSRISHWKCSDTRQQLS